MLNISINTVFAVLPIVFNRSGILASICRTELIHLLAFRITAYVRALCFRC